MEKQKQHIKHKIVSKKYFEETEPRFLTFAERELICKLHETNPEDWPVEKLSESFPALPNTIYKILHSKWSPRSVESVKRYDNVAVENWKLFRSGKLPVSPIFRDHLTKFKDRKIILTDRESLAKQFVLSKPEFPKPKSQLFTNIVQTYLNQKQNNMKLLSQEDNSNKALDTSNNFDKNKNLLTSSTTNRLATINNPKESTLNNENHLTSSSQTDSKQCNEIVHNRDKSMSRPLTFDEFVKARLVDVHKESPEEGATLLDVYKKQMNVSQEKQAAEVAEPSDTAVIAREDSTVSKNIDRYSHIAVDDNLIDTHIKVWHKKIDTSCSYVNPIKIAKNVYKPGMTYRIGDCYYDDDGEFLYRVPGMQN